MQLYGRGIRRRLAPMLGDRRRLELAYSLLFSLPGTPVCATATRSAWATTSRLPERDAVRTPMQWSDEPKTAASPRRPRGPPVIAKGVYGYENVNVERAAARSPVATQLDGADDPAAQGVPRDRLGRHGRLSPQGSRASSRSPTDWRGDTVVCVHNVAGEAYDVSLSAKLDGESLTNILVDEDIARDDRGRFRFPLEAYGYRWFRLGRRREALRRGTTVA